MDSSVADLFDLGSRVALVTGGARGIGRGIAEALAAAGAAVTIADMDLEGANSVAQALHERRLRAFAVQADVADEESVKAMVEGAYAHFGRLDILVNNAGIFPMKRLRELDAATWDRTIGVNLRGAYLSTRYAAERIIEGHAGGRIVNISTINTARTYLGMAHYDSSKYGLNALTKASALEYAPFGITVNAIAPGAVKTPGSLKVRSELGGGSVEAADAEFAKRIPLGRWAEPEDIGRAVLCLTGRAADYITGQIIYVDGGLMLGF
jgi:NAD(P)-dependent dehydrogenase (short-subunit alcohol dehydrogenase family)